MVDLCEICKKDFDVSDLFVDHRHSDGLVRALLCRHCNSMLGFAREDIKILQAGIDFLIYFNGVK